jgi:hypothetical protein
MMEIIRNGQAGDRATMAVTSAYLQHEKIRREEDDEETPTYLGGNLRQRLRHKDQK